MKSHGQGGPPQSECSSASNYLRWLAFLPATPSISGGRRCVCAAHAALRPFLAGSTTPLVLAAVDPVRSIFRGLNSYPHLLDAVIETNPDRATDQELATAARGILLEQQAADGAGLAELFQPRSSQRRAPTEVTDAARAATAGAVDTLVVDRDLLTPGTVEDDGTVKGPDAATGQVYGVVDEIARRVLLTGGTVLSVDAASVRGGQGFAAIVRYPW